jgi:hypothetical protein
LELLRLHQHKAVPSIPVSLVGNNITNEFAELRHNNVRYFFDLERLEVNLRVIDRVSEAIKRDWAPTLQEYDSLKYG